MNNFTNLILKSTKSRINSINKFLVESFNNISLKNISKLIKDQRLVFIILITIFTVMAHLSTPAFYKKNWVKNKIENQLGESFKIQFILNNKFSYSIFPQPHFIFKDISLASQNKELAKVDSLKVYLSMTKFFNKNKLNIEFTKIDNAKFSVFKNNFFSFFKFFDEKINEKKMSIVNSKIFLVDENEEIYSIIKLKKTDIFYDNLDFLNKLNFSGEVFNNPIKINFTNDFIEKNADSNIDLSKISLNFKNKLNYSNEPAIGSIFFSKLGKTNLVKFELDDQLIKFQSEKKINKQPLFNGEIVFKPFFSLLNINLNNLNISKLLSNDSFFLKILKSEILLNENLSYQINVNSNGVVDNRNLNNAKIKINFNQNQLSFSDSQLNFKDKALIELIDGDFVSNKDNQFFVGELEINISDINEIYRFFLTRKELRKEIKKINIAFKYDLNSDILNLKRININDDSDDRIQSFIDDFNIQNINIKSRIVLRNLFNNLMEYYSG